MLGGHICTLLFCLSMVILPLLPKRMMAWWMTYVMASFLFLNGTIKGRDKYLKFKNNCSKGILTFVHPYWFDMFPIIHLLGEVPRGTIKAKYLIGPLRLFASRLKALAVQDKPSGLSTVIKEAIQARQPGEELICICPVGTTTTTYQDDVPEYKSKGAFHAMPTIMPIVMYYSFFSVWDKQSLFDVICERTCGDILHYYVKVLDPISPHEDEKVEDYMKRVHDYTQEGLYECKQEFKIKSSNINPKLLFFSELLDIILIFLYIQNTFLLMLLFYLVITRFLFATPQYDLLFRIYTKIMMVYMIYFVISVGIDHFFFQ